MEKHGTSTSRGLGAIFRRYVSILIIQRLEETGDFCEAFLPDKPTALRRMATDSDSGRNRLERLPSIVPKRGKEFGVLKEMERAAAGKRIIGWKKCENELLR